MLRLVEYGLLAVSLLTVVGLVLMTPRDAAPGSAETTDVEKRPIGKG